MLTSQLPDVAQTRRQRTELVDLLVLGGTIVTMDQTRRIINDGGIAVSEGRIVAIGPRADIERAYTSRQQVNAAGKVITPGLINGHTHVPMVLFRGLADDLDLQEWLTKYIFPAEAKNVTAISVLLRWLSRQPVRFRAYSVSSLIGIGTSAFWPTTFVQVDERHWDRKVRALSCYESEFSRVGAAWVDFQDRQTRNYGTQLGVGRAEGFVTIKNLT
jgi:hypothetical protein